MEESTCKCGKVVVRKEGYDVKIQGPAIAHGPFSAFMRCVKCDEKIRVGPNLIFVDENWEQCRFEDRYQLHKHAREDPRKAKKAPARKKTSSKKTAAAKASMIQFVEDLPGEEI